MAKVVNWLLWKKGSTGYHCKQDQLTIIAKGSTGCHGKRGQLAIIAKGVNWLSWQKWAMTIMTKVGNDYHDKSGQ